VGGSEILVGRQPIFDNSRKVHGYELLLRAGERTDDGTDRTGAGEGDLITSRVLFGSLQFGVDRFVGDKSMFCDVSEDLLDGDFTVLLPPERTVLEVPAHALFPADASSAGATSRIAVAAAGATCRRLIDEGYMLALDGFSWFEGADEWLGDFAYAKVDPHRLEPDALSQVIERCRRSDVTVIAQSVDTERDMDESEALGAELFQGYLLATPQLIEGRVLDPGEFTKARLAATLLEPDAGIGQIESLVRTDPALSLQVLHVAGIGAAGGMRRTVSTLHEALVLVGWRRLQAWVSLLLFSGGRGIAEESMITALARARMCELLSCRVPGGRGDVAFTAGMLSGLDVLLGMPLGDVLRDLPLDDAVRDAVLDHAGPVGTLVADVIDYQLGRIELATRSGLGAAALQSACFDALAWGTEMATGLDAAAVA
jgi:EAL and modified HD-GYP domain-containing signal transduction protein